MNAKLLLQLVALFLITQAIGLYVAADLIKQDVQAVIVTENPEDVSNAAGLFIYILAFTAVFMLVIKLLKRRHLIYAVLKILETAAIFATSLIVFSAFVPEIAFMFSVLIVALRIVMAENIWLRNASSVLAVAGAGALIGVSLGILPVLLLVIGLAIYDLVAVFWTKHMVTMAKSISKSNLAFTYALPTKEHQFELGTGDLVIPLLFATSVMKASSATVAFPYYILAATLILMGSLAGLLWTINFVSKRVGTALPALPPQSVCMVVMLFVCKAAGLLP